LNGAAFGAGDFMPFGPKLKVFSQNFQRPNFIPPFYFFGFPYFMSVIPSPHEFFIDFHPGQGFPGILWD
jgi:hypothetical protein